MVTAIYKSPEESLRIATKLPRRVVGIATQIPNATGLTIPINLYHVPVSEQKGNTNSQASGIEVVKT